MCELQQFGAVLVVEDEPLIRMNAAAFVEKAGYLSYEAANAAEAVQLLERKSDIRVVFTDVHMPGSMDGLKLAHYVRRRWPLVKIIVASGKVKLDEDDLPKGGAFFSKPYRPKEITRKLREMMAEAA